MCLKQIIYQIHSFNPGNSLAYWSVPCFVSAGSIQYSIVWVNHVPEFLTNNMMQLDRDQIWSARASYRHQLASTGSSNRTFILFHHLYISCCNDIPTTVFYWQRFAEYCTYGCYTSEKESRCIQRRVSIDQPRVITYIFNS